jgi:hypothetical protein
MPSLDRADPKAELRLLKPGTKLSRQAESFRKWLQDPHRRVNC